MTIFPVSVIISAAGSVNDITVLTAGAKGGDFNLSSSQSCSPGETVVIGETCIFSVAFRPKYPGRRLGAITVSDSSGSIIGASSFVQTGTGSLAVFVPGQISTIAGDAYWLYNGDGEPATDSSLFLPYGVAVDTQGNLFVADSNNNRIRRVDGVTGLISTVAGNGSTGFSGDNGPAISAGLSSPTSVALDGFGNLYIADTGNQVIRLVDSKTGYITTVAGVQGQQGYTGDGGPAMLADLSNPNGIALDGAGKLYIADSSNNLVRVVDLQTTIIRSFAGDRKPMYAGDGGQATVAGLHYPWGVTVAPNGDLYIADQYNHAIRRVAGDGTISTVAGNGLQGFSGDGGPAVTASLNEPASVAIDAAGNLYIADSGNNVVRKVSASTGIITSVVGNAMESFSGDSGPADQASLYGPYTLAIDGPGNLYIADLFHNRIRKVASNVETLTVPDIRVLRSSATILQTLENDGNAPLNIASVIGVTNAKVDTTVTTCVSSAPLPSNGTCVIGAHFAPTVTGNPVQGTIAISSNAANTPGTITLAGKVLELDPPTLSLTSSGSPSATGSSVLFSVAVASAGIIPTGSLTLLDGNAPIGAATLTASATAKFSISSLLVGSHIITVAYSGDTNNAPGTSAAITQNVKDGTTLAISSTANPAGVSSNLILSATISGDTVTPTGAVSLLDGSTTIATVNPMNGTATFNISTLGVGTHVLTTSYAGDNHSLPSVSEGLTEIIQKAASATALTSSSLEAPFSTPILVTATVTSVSAGTATGTVTFQEGATQIGSAALDAHGLATLSLSSLAVNTHTITAIYSGDDNNASSTSMPIQETIDQIATSTTLSVGANPSNAGVPLHMVATVSPMQTVPGTPLIGSITFFDGATALGSVDTTNGTADLDTATLAVGSHTIRASFTGAKDYASSSSSTMSVQVSKGSTTGVLAASANPLIAGKPMVLTETLSSTGITPTGDVVFGDTLGVLGQTTINAQGVATYSTSSLRPGLHLLTGKYSGDANSLPTTSTFSLQVQLATTTTTLAPSQNPSLVGAVVVLRGTVTGNGGVPSGSILFRDGANDLGIGQVGANGTAALSVPSLSVGTHVITALYSGDTNDATSAAVAFNEVIQQTETITALTTSPNPSPQGSAFQVSVKVSSNGLIPTGSVQLLDGNSSLGTAVLNSSGLAIFNVPGLTIGAHNLKANYLGDVNDGTSTSPVLVQTVQPTTAVTLTSDHNPANAGAALTFSAAVSGSATVPTGTVTFRDGSAIVGTASLNSAGVGMVVLNTLVPSLHIMSASYSGDSSNSASTSNAYDEVVQQAPTQVQLALNTGSATLASPVTLTATVVGLGGIPGGRINFSDGNTIIASGTLTSSSVLSVAVSAFSLGQHSLSAAYLGDVNDLPSTSGTQDIVILKATPTLRITTSNNPSLGGASITLSARLSAAVNSPSGTITWTDGGVLIGTTAVGSDGTTVLAISSLSVGPHAIAAAFAGDPSNAAAFGTLTQQVQLATSSTLLTSDESPAAIGDSVTYTVSVSGTGGVPTGTVVIKDGSSNLATLSLNSVGKAMVTVLASGPGEHPLTAVYPGDPNHSGSEASFAESLLQGTRTSVLPSSNPSVAGRLVILTAFVVPSAGTVPTGTVTFKDGTTVLGSAPLNVSGSATLASANISVGQHAISAIYSGDSTSQPSTSPTLVETIVDASTQTTIASSANPSTSGAAITFTVQVTGQGAIPTGQVIIQDGPLTLGQVTLSAAGVASLSTGALTPGQHSISAFYKGDASDSASTSSALTQLVQQRSVTTISSNSNPSLTGDPIILNISVTSMGVGVPTGTVTLKDGAAILGTGLLANNGTTIFNIPLLAAGQHSLTCTYSGDTQTFGSSSLVFLQSVQLRATATSLTASLSSVTQGQTITLFAVVQGAGPTEPTGGVIFSSGSTFLGTASVNASGVATLNFTPTSGTYNATAVYQGDAVYSGSTSKVVPLSVAAAAQFTLTSDLPALSLQSKQHTSVSLTLTSIKSFQDVIALGCVGLPYAATCTFSNDQVALNANATATASLVLDTGTPLGSGGTEQAGSSHSTKPGTLLCFLPLGALCSFLFGSRRQRGRVGALLMFVPIFIAMGTITGCGTLNVKGTPPGKYTIRVTGIGATSGQTVSQTITLTVTQ